MLQSFAKESPGSDGWTVEFFLKYFGITGADVQEVFEESRTMGLMESSLNLNFIALIPKVAQPSNFGEFKPIALCTLNYKVIAKLIGL
jgi:hypothetical protein